MLSGFCPASFRVMFYSVVPVSKLGVCLSVPLLISICGSIQMHPLYGALPVPYVPERVTRGALVAHLVTYAPHHYRTSQYRRTFIPLSVSLWNDVPTLYSMVRDWCVFRAGPMFFHWPEAMLRQQLQLLIFYCFLFLSSPSVVWHSAAGDFGLIGCKYVYPSLNCIAVLFEKNNFSAVNQVYSGIIFEFQNCVTEQKLLPKVP